MQCTQCLSAALQKLSLVYESGVSHIDTRTSGVGVGIGRGGMGVGAGRGRTRGTQISTTAAKAAPPAQKRNDKRVIFGVFFGLIALPALHSHSVGTGLVMLAIAGLCIWSAVTDMMWNRNVWPGLYQHWDSSYLCTRCGFMGPPRMVQQMTAAPQQTLNRGQDELPS